MHIFLSYAKADTRDYALKLNDRLNRLSNVSCWVDRSLKPGHNWVYQIRKQIGKCDLMVVLLSPDVNREPDDIQDMSFVINEIHEARNKRKTILPVIVQDTDVPMEINTLECIDLVQNLEVGEQRLFSYINVSFG